MEKNLLMGQSGGPTAVINASLYGAVYAARNQKDSFGSVYGMLNGIEGFLDDRYIDMESVKKAGQLELIKTTPGSYLGSCRYRLPENLDDEVYRVIFRKLKDCNVGYFLYIGGNDSMDTISKLSRYAKKTGSEIKFVGIPKTIDNDLVGTDHAPGYGSAAKYIASTVREIVLDASVYDNKASVTIVEIMGRNAGWLAASCVLARKFKGDNPALIYLPETVFNQEAFIQKVKQNLEINPNLVVCISEGIHDENGVFICELANKVEKDTFGHKMLTGAGKYLENLMKERIGVKTRSIELNVNQRCSAELLSEVDLKEAIAVGEFGVKSVRKGTTGKMVILKRTNYDPYRVEYSVADIGDICNKEKAFPLEWITEGGTNISEEFIEYAKPLIYGNVKLPIREGLPEFAYRR